MAPSMLIYFLVFVIGAYYAVAAVFTFIVYLFGALLVIAYTKQNYTLIVVLRIALFTCTAFGFFIMFIDDLIFKDAVGMFFIPPPPPGVSYIYPIFIGSMKC